MLYLFTMSMIIFQLYITDNRVSTPNADHNASRCVVSIRKMIINKFIHTTRIRIIKFYLVGLMNRNQGVSKCPNEKRHNERIRIAKLVFSIYAGQIVCRTHCRILNDRAQNLTNWSPTMPKTWTRNTLAWSENETIREVSHVIDVLNCLLETCLALVCSHVFVYSIEENGKVKIEQVEMMKFSNSEFLFTKVGSQPRAQGRPCSFYSRKPPPISHVFLR